MSLAEVLRVLDGLATECKYGVKYKIHQIQHVHANRIFFLIIISKYTYFNTEINIS